MIYTKFQARLCLTCIASASVIIFAVLVPYWGVAMASTFAGFMSLVIMGMCHLCVLIQDATEGKDNDKVDSRPHS